MNYRDFIFQFQRPSLLKVVEKIVAGFMKTETLVLDASFWPRTWLHEEIEKALQGKVSEYPLVLQYLELAEKDDTYVTLNKILVRGTQSDVTNWIINTLNDFNDATIRVNLENKMGLTHSIDDDALRPMVILSYLPQDEVKSVCLRLNIDISGTEESRLLGGLFSNPNAPNWTLINRVASYLETPPEDKPHPKLQSPTDNKSSQPVAPKPANVIQHPTTQRQQANNAADIFHYIGAAILGFFFTGLLAMVFTVEVPGLTGVAGILGAVGAAFLTNMYKNSQHGQSTPTPRIEVPPKVVEPPPPTPIMEPPPSTQTGISANCPKCGDTSPDEATHCISCGNKLPELICPNCQTENISRAKFCMGCGQER